MGTDKVVQGRLAQLLGRLTERRVERLLCRAGMRCIARNWRCKGGELDLVMQDGDTLVFVEVRRRSRSDRGSGAESLDLRKRRRLVLAAGRYLQQLREQPPCRFDLVAVDGREGREELRWIRAAFDVSD